MIKLTTIAMTLLFATTTLLAQDMTKAAEVSRTKMDVLSSKTGTITKFIDTRMPALKTSFTRAETRIRKVTNGSSTDYFYQIKKRTKKDSSIIASVEYSDVLEVIKAVKTLQIDAEKDIASKPYFIENKFITVDGFHVGYYIKEGKTWWYLKLKENDITNTLYMSSGGKIEEAFVVAKNKIEELKK